MLFGVSCNSGNCNLFSSLLGFVRDRDIHIPIGVAKSGHHLRFHRCRHLRCFFKIRYLSSCFPCIVSDQTYELYLIRKKKDINRDRFLNMCTVLSNIVGSEVIVFFKLVKTKLADFVVFVGFIRYVLPTVIQILGAHRKCNHWFT